MTITYYLIVAFFILVIIFLLVCIQQRDNDYQKEKILLESLYDESFYNLEDRLRNRYAGEKHDMARMHLGEIESMRRLCAAKEIRIEQLSDMLICKNIEIKGLNEEIQKLKMNAFNGLETPIGEEKISL